MSSQIDHHHFTIICLLMFKNYSILATVLRSTVYLVYYFHIMNNIVEWVKMLQLLQLCVAVKNLDEPVHNDTRETSTTSAKDDTFRPPVLSLSKWVLVIGLIFVFIVRTLQCFVCILLWMFLSPNANLFTDWSPTPPQALHVVYFSHCNAHIPSQ